MIIEVTFSKSYDYIKLCHWNINTDMNNAQISTLHKPVLIHKGVAA